MLELDQKKLEINENWRILKIKEVLGNFSYFENYENFLIFAKMKFYEA